MKESHHLKILTVKFLHFLHEKCVLSAQNDINFGYKYKSSESVFYWLIKIWFIQLLFGRWKKKSHWGRGCLLVASNFILVLKYTHFKFCAN